MMATQDLQGTKDAEETQRKLKRLEENRKDWAEQAQKETKRQQQEIETLKRENEQLAARLSIQRTSPAHFSGSGTATSTFGTQQPSKKIAMQKAKELEQRLEYAQELEQKIEEENERADELEERIRDEEQHIRDARDTMGGVNITKESNQMIQRQIGVLENRLDKSLVKFNKALDVNKKLRKEIDDLSRERLAFDAIYKELEKELQVKKKKMACIIELSNIAYEERDNAANELAQLKVYAAKEMQSFEETFKELDELLEEDRKMKEAIKSRMAERPVAAASAAGASQRAAPSPDSSDDLAKTKARQGNMNKSTSRPGVLGTSSALGDSGMTVQQYEEAFQKIKLATNISDINQLVSKFLHSEDDNFSLFNYVNELNNEIEKLEEARNQVKEEAERVKAQDGVGGADAASRKRVLKSLEDKLLVEEENTKKYKAKAEKTVRILEDVMATVQTIFNSLGCDETQIVESHGIAGLTENNILLYLAAVENHTDGLIRQWRRLHAPDGQTVPAGPMKGPAVPQGSAAVQIDIPSTGDEFNDGYSDEEDRVLTREELQTKTQNKLSKLTAGGADRKGNRKAKAKKPGNLYPQ